MLAIGILFLITTHVRARHFELGDPVWCCFVLLEVGIVLLLLNFESLVTLICKVMIILTGIMLPLLFSFCACVTC